MATRIRDLARRAGIIKRSPKGRLLRKWVRVYVPTGELYTAPVWWRRTVWKPGKWNMVSNTLSHCINGFHCTDNNRANVSSWEPYGDAQLWEVEAAEPSADNTAHGTKWVYRYMRLVKRVK